MRCEGQVGGHRYPWDVRKYGPQNQKVAVFSRRQRDYWQCHHFELALWRVGPLEEPRMHVCVSLWVTLAWTERLADEELRDHLKCRQSVFVNV